MSAEGIPWSERWQKGLQMALGHDLPNHLVAIQGMLRLLELEQSENLSAEGQGYLKRLTAATARTQSLIRFMHLYVQAGRASESWEDVQLADTADGITAEVQALFPDRAIDFVRAFRTPTVRLPGRSFRLVLLQLLAQAVQGLGQGKSVLEIGSAETPENCLVWVAEKVELDGLAVHERLAAAGAGDGRKTDHQLNVLLVREIVAAWNVRLWADLEPGHPLLLALILPPRPDG